MGKLEKVTFDFGSHVVSGLCAFIPALYWACHQSGFSEITIDLLAENPIPGSLINSEELAEIIPELRGKFFSILSKHSSTLGGIVSWLTIAADFSESSQEAIHLKTTLGLYYQHSPYFQCFVKTYGAGGKCYEKFFASAPV